MERLGPQREVFAHVSRAAMICSLMFWPVFMGIVAFLLYIEVSDHRLTAVPLYPQDYLAFKHVQVVVTLTMCVIGLCFLLYPVMRQLGAYISSRGTALWVEGDRLVYADRKKLDVALAEIKSVDELDVRHSSRSFSTPARMIAIGLKNGQKKTLPAYFVEDRFAVVTALRRRIGLPEVEAGK